MPDAPDRPSPIRTKRQVAGNLAARILARSWTLPAVADAIATMFGEVPPRTRAALAVRVYELGETTYPPSPGTLVAFLLRSEFFNPKRGSIVALDTPTFAPLPRFAGLAIPPLATTGDLGAWLSLSAEELDWLCGLQREVQTPKLQHYHYVLTRKRNGTPRLLEAPKERLKAFQRRILRDILAPVTVHDAAHGFVAGRSCVTGAHIHAGEAVVATFDLAEFFPSIAAPRIHGIFRALGYPWSVARHLTGLCTTVTPLNAIDALSLTPVENAGLRSSHRVRHLPQGAPTSPALANLLAWRLDHRLHGLARAAGANYTRYADDLAFSGDDAFARALDRFSLTVTIIAGEEGFRLKPAKTRIMPRRSRQRVTGLVVNAHVNVERAAYDALKAILHNCARGDPREQNRADVADFRRHLDGRIAWVAQVNPVRGRKLWEAFDRIGWPPE